jgi:hypothetical protein
MADRDWTTPEGIAEVLRLDAEATPGPLVVERRDDETALVYATHMGPFRVVVPVAETTKVNAPAIAAYRTAAPALARALKAEREKRCETCGYAHGCRGALTFACDYSDDLPVTADHGCRAWRPR